MRNARFSNQRTAITASGEAVRLKITQNNAYSNFPLNSTYFLPTAPMPYIMKEMADDKADEAQKDGAPEGPKKILGMPMPQFLFVLINTLVMIGGLAFIVWASLLYKKPAITNQQAVEEIKKKAEEPKLQTSDGVFFESYSEMTITLKGQQGGKNHYVTAEVSLRCGSEECLNQVKANKAKIEDAIQTAISSRTYTELGSLEVKLRVKHEIMSRVNSFLKGTAVVDVLFTSFLVQ